MDRRLESTSPTRRGWLTPFTPREIVLWLSVPVVGGLAMIFLIPMWLRAGFERRESACVSNVQSLLAARATEAEVVAKVGAAQANIVPDRPWGISASEQASYSKHFGAAKDTRVYTSPERTHYYAFYGRDGRLSHMLCIPDK
jgi:hypothetical protein